MRLEGLRLNGYRLEGLRLKGYRLEGLRLNGYRLEGLRLNGYRLEGLRLNACKQEGLRPSSILTSLSFKYSQGLGLETHVLAINGHIIMDMGIISYYIYRYRHG